jgi:long-chain acyl-CoA synthetase
MQYLIHHFLENSADRCPEKEAVVHGGSSFTYLDVEKYANSVANWLHAAGLKRGDRIALLHRNSIGYIGSYYGILKAGAVVVPLNTGVDARETAIIIEDCQAKILISETYFSPLIKKLLDSDLNSIELLAMSDNTEDIVFDLQSIQLSELSRISSEYRPCVASIDQDLSTIVYTSGSTGKPNGVMLSHLNVVANTESIVSYLDLRSDERCMVILPFYYVYGKSLLNSHFSVSGTVIIDNRFAYPNAILQTMIERKATSFAGVPSAYSALFKRSSINEMGFPDLRYFTQAGGNMPSEMRNRMNNRFPNRKFFVMYGTTEASARLAYLEPDLFSRKTESVGKAVPNVELKIVTEDGNEAIPGEEGEIVARGSNIMLGYWNAPGETREVLKDGWYYTGDLGVNDEDGDLCISGRKRDIIKVGIYKISAKEIEEILYTYPGIHEVVVIGIPDEDLGEAVKAVIVPDPETVLCAEKIMDFCSINLSAYKIPKVIEFMRELPKNQAGKVMKEDLSELFRGRS